MRLPLHRTCRLLVVVLLLIVLSNCHTAYAADPASPVVVIDQFHLNMLTLYPQAMWRITALRDELIACGYDVRELWQSITTESLSGCSVLVITTPNRIYTDAERNALKNFVNNGGGVLFTASYGIWNEQPTSWAPICQSVAGSLGFNLDNNLPSDSLHNMYGYSYWISFPKECLGSHPVNTGVNQLQSFSTTTLAESVPPVLSSSTVIARTDNDAVPSSRPAIMAGLFGSGRVLTAGSPLYFADPVPDRDIGGQLVTMEGIEAADNRLFAYNVITWLAGSAARPLIDVTYPGADSIVYGSVNIRGTVCDATLSGYVVEYAPAPVSESTSWVQVGSAKPSSVVMGNLGTWDTNELEPGNYVLRIKGTNVNGNSFSRLIPVQVKRLNTPVKLSDIESLSNGALVALMGKEVIAGTDDLNGRIYLEEQDRSSGVAVITSLAVTRGNLANVLGTLSISDGVPVITAIEVKSQPGPVNSIGPLGVSNALAGRSVSGLTTIGMLVKVWGKVLSFDSEGFIIDDGSLYGGLKIFTNLSKSPVTAPEAGSTVAVTGVGASNGTLPAVIVRDSVDIVPL